MSEGPRIVLNITRIIIVALGLSGLAPAVTFAADKVPSGNRNAEQPAIPGASVRRTKAGKTSFDVKYEKVRDLLRTDSALVGKIKKTASAYGIAPIHMVGAIVGEHTYNVDAYDRLQTYYVKAISYMSSAIAFAHDGEPIEDFVERGALLCAQPGLRRAVEFEDPIRTAVDHLSPVIAPAQENVEFLRLLFRQEGRDCDPAVAGIFTRQRGCIDSFVQPELSGHSARVPKSASKSRIRPPAAPRPRRLPLARRTACRPWGWPSRAPAPERSVRAGHRDGRSCRFRAAR